MVTLSCLLQALSWGVEPAPWARAPQPLGVPADTQPPGPRWSGPHAFFLFPSNICCVVLLRASPCPCRLSAWLNSFIFKGAFQAVFSPGTTR